MLYIHPDKSQTDYHVGLVEFLKAVELYGAQSFLGPASFHDFPFTFGLTAFSIISIFFPLDTFPVILISSNICYSILSHLMYEFMELHCTSTCTQVEVFS